MDKVKDKKKGTKLWSKMMGMSVEAARAKKQAKKDLDSKPKQ